MSKRIERKRKLHEKNKKRVRSKIFGSPKRPRFSVERSNKHIYVQIINDAFNQSLVQVSDMTPDIREECEGKTKTEKSRIVGKLAAKRAMDQGIEKVVFDRSGYKYHGRVKAVAEGAREEGLEF